jgi:acetyl/propionyl-CoA carboxylase alpha subunit/acetyl-CoA carboxylase carboxyltransferase component
MADEQYDLQGEGVGPYLDPAKLVDAAVKMGCDALHPGYGFLSESAALARACAAGDVVFVGPTAATLDLFGDKGAARASAAQAGVPTLAGTNGSATLEEARAFVAALPSGQAAMLKAVSGGGGRGVRIVRGLDGLDEAYARCQSEAQRAFGSGDVYLEEMAPRARHIEVQIAGDVGGAIVHLWDRDCSLQRRFQKVVEIAPAPGVPEGLRARILDAALRLGRAVGYVNIGTIEFLVDASGPLSDGSAFWFIEANPRLQVEHTVTEEVTGVDLVRLQLDLAAGRMLGALGLESAPQSKGFAIEVRVNAESMTPEGDVRPSSGVLRRFQPPTGPGVRLDTAVSEGDEIPPAFDSLIAKLIVRSGGDFRAAVDKTARALAEFDVRGVSTNIGFARRLLELPEVRNADLHTALLQGRTDELARILESSPPQDVEPRSATPLRPSDPLAILAYGKAAGTLASALPNEAFQEWEMGVLAPVQGTIVAVQVSEGAEVTAGAELVVIESMKMEHVVVSPADGVVLRVLATAHETVREGQALVAIAATDRSAGPADQRQEQDLTVVREDLAEVLQRQARVLDAARPEAMARRHAMGRRSAREYVAGLCDEGSFVEYGALAVAAQRRRHPIEYLIERTPADGLLLGLGRVNGDRFGPKRSRCVVMTYDYTVHAGTQGGLGHRKMDRVFELAHQQRLPVVMFAEGGGGRSGDTDGSGVAGLSIPTFQRFARLSGLVPLVGVDTGVCFAGNAALLGCCDVIIATRNSNIGMGGPALIESAGLGMYRPEEIGPMSVQTGNGVVDVLVESEADAIAAAKKYLSYFQGAFADWRAEDQRRLRFCIPDNRRRAYDMRELIEILADTDTVMELRPHFGRGMITTLARIEGEPLGVIANNPLWRSGAIDSDGADKAARFMQLCDAYDLPILVLCDTPGIMVGPEAEKEGLVRHASRIFVTAASITTPTITVVVRKAYGLGAMAMGGGSFQLPMATYAWPTGEFGGMGLEGMVKLGMRKELEAIVDPEARKAKFDELVAQAYAHGKALSAGSYFEVDDVIDPADTRARVVACLSAAAPVPPRSGRKRAFIDTW